MGMTGHHELDVLQLEPEGLDVRANHVVHLVDARVEENVSLRRDDEIGRQPLGAHVIDVADDAEMVQRARSNHPSAPAWAAQTLLLSSAQPQHTSDA